MKKLLEEVRNARRKARAAKYRQEHREEERARTKRWREKYPDKNRDNSRKHRLEQPGEVKAYAEVYRANHRECNIIYAKKYRLEYPEDKNEKSARERKHLYGISQKQYDQLLHNQNNVCKICGGINISGKVLFVDHDHETGRTRSLLCHRCNAAYGLLGEDPDWIQRLLEYAEDNLRIKYPTIKRKP